MFLPMTTNDEIRENQRTVITALRSGEYTQCKNTWYDEEEQSNCAVGLFTRILLKPLSAYGYVGMGDHVLNLLVPHIPGEFSHSTLLIKITGMNDRGASFNDIADYLVHCKGWADVVEKKEPMPITVTVKKEEVLSDAVC